MVFKTGPPDYLGCLKWSVILVFGACTVAYIAEGPSYDSNTAEINTSEECFIMRNTISLNQYAQFRKDSLTLAGKLNTMVEEGDAIVASDLSDSEKGDRILSIVNTYLPDQ